MMSSGYRGSHASILALDRGWTGKQISRLFCMVSLELELWWAIPWDLPYGKDHSVYFHTVLTAHIQRYSFF